MNASVQPLGEPVLGEPDLLDRSAPVLRQGPGPVVLQSPTPAHMLQAAIERGADLSVIEKFMELQERWEKREAEKAYVAAITSFKQNPPEILKRKRVFFESSKGTVDYMHAELSDVCAAAIKGLADVGISHRWELKQEGDRITVTCILTHALGHSERTALTGSPDTSGSKNNIQAVASTVTYLERYTLLAATGLAAKGMDTDGRTEEGEQPRITEQQAADLVALMSEANVSREKFLLWARVATVEDIEPRNYLACVQALRARIQGRV